MRDTLETAGPGALADLAAAQVLVRLAELSYDLQSVADTISDAVAAAKEKARVR
jgi:hypothetical protein